MVNEQNWRRTQFAIKVKQAIRISEKYEAIKTNTQLSRGVNSFQEGM